MATIRDEELLAQLSESLSPGELTAAIERLLRVPEAWSQLHLDEFLSAAKDAFLPGALTPAKLAGLALGSPLGLGQAAVPAALTTRADDVWQAAQDGTQPTTLVDVSLLAHRLLHTEIGDAAETIARHPAAWRSAWACAFPSFANAPAMAGPILADARPELVSLVANALLADASIDASALRFAQLTDLLPGHLAAALQISGEERLARKVSEIAASEEKAVALKGIEDQIDSAAVLHASGSTDSSRRLLEAAWERSQDLKAEIADRLAEVADREADMVVAHQARLMAFQNRPTPIRRAWVARLQAESGRPAEALDELPAVLETIEEKASAAIACRRLGEEARARSLLGEAAQELARRQPSDPRWFRVLFSELEALAEVETALRVGEHWVKSFPADLRARLDWAGTLLRAADSERAVAQARLVFVLEPGSQEARRILAAGLQSLGSPAEALPHWIALAAADAAHLPSLARCALEAGQLDVAEQSAIALLDQSVDAAEGHIVKGMVHLARGDAAQAKAVLSGVVDRWPLLSEAWLALAECQGRLADDEGQGETLTRAARALPASGDVQMARARWLAAHGQWTEAAAGARVAVDAEPARPDRLADLGEYLRQTGEIEPALAALREAHGRAPGLWAARRSLAGALETVGHVEEAASLIDQMPHDAQAGDWLSAGRIHILAGEKNGSAELAERGRFFVEQAAAHPSQAEAAGDPAIAFWLGRAHEFGGRHADAMSCYRDCLAASSDSEERRQATLGVARTALAHGEIATALSTLEEAQRQYPDWHAVFALLSRAYLSADLPEQALLVAEKWLQADPGEDALFNLGQVASRASRWDRAMQAFRQLTQRLPEEAQPWLHLTQALWNLGDRPGARGSAARALLLARRSPALLAQSAARLRDIGEPKAAQRVLRTAASSEPEVRAHWLSLAQVSDEVNDAVTSHEAWSRLAEMDPADPSAWKGAAQAAWKRNMRSAAIGHWQKAISLNPSDSALHVTLARALVENGETAASLKVYAAARALRPDDADLQLESGQAELRAGQAETALEILVEAAQAAPADPAGHMAVAECLLALGRPTEAGHALETAMHSGERSARAHAMLSLVTLSFGDLPRALAQLAEARTRPLRSAADAHRLAQAARRLGQWAIAVQVLHERFESSAEKSVLADSLLTRLHILNAHWLYAVAGEAVRHAPAASLVGPEALEENASLLEAAAVNPIDEAPAEILRYAFSASAGDCSVETLDFISQQIAAAGQPVLTEALAIGYLRAQRGERAAALLETQRGTTADGWRSVLAGFAHSQAGHPALALEWFESAAEDPAVRPMAQYLEGRTYLAQGQPESAMRPFNSALSAWPDEPAWQIQLASVYLDQGAIEPALPHVQQAVELAPEHGDYRLILARTLREAGQLSEATAAYEHVVRAMPGVGSVWKEAGLLALAMGDAPRAKSWFERACTLSPSDPTCLMGAARACAAIGKVREANAHAQAAHRLAPEDPDVLLGMGEILASQGKSEKALEAYEAALKGEGDPLPILISRAKLLRQSGKAAQAVAELRDLTTTHSENDAAWRAYADACEDAGDWQAGLEAVTRAAKLAPRSVSHRLAIARMARKSGQLDRALGEAMQAQTLGELDAQVALEVGRIHEERRELKRALDAYDRAMELGPDIAEPHLRAGMILKDLKAYAQSARRLKRAVELNPSDADALHQLAAVRALELVHGGISQPAVSA